MKKWLWVWLPLFLCVVPASAQNNRAFGWCEVGGVVGTVSGLTVSPDIQASYPGCIVTVYLTGTLTLATIYNDTINTPKANPFTADLTTGYWFFYAASGRYDITISGSGISSPFTLADYPLAQGSGGGGVGTVTSFSSGNLSPLFTVAVATPTSTPALSFTASQFPAHTYYGNNTGASALPGSVAIQTSDLPFTYSGNTTKLATESGVVASGHCPQADSNGNFVDSGNACLGAIFSSDNSWTNNDRFCGPIPFIDITCSTYGARPLATNLGNLSQTGTINAGSAGLTLSAAGQYQNGDHIVVVGAGSGNSVGTSAPSAPTVTPSISSGPLNSGEVANSATGATTYSYEIAWCDLATFACTPASGPTTITNGQATLGRITISITSISRSGTTATVTTAATHTLNVGSCSTTTCAEVQIWKGSDPSFTGFSRIGTVADNTHFTYTTPGSTTYGATASSTGGQFEYFQGNHISCGSAPVTTAICTVYGRASGSYAFIGAGRMGESYWDDWGTTISGSPLQPGFVSSSPPSTFQNNSLNTTVLMGAGTTNVTLAASASTSVTSQYTTIDQCPILQSAATAARVGASQVYIPPSGSGNTAFVIGSYCPLGTTQGVSIRQAGALWLTAPIALQGNGHTWISERNGSNTATSLTFVSNTAPGIYLASSVGGIFDGWTIQSQNNNNGLLILSDQGTGVYTENFSFVTGNSGSGGDYLGMAEVVRGGGFDNYWINGYVDGNYPNGGSNLGDTTAPNFLFVATPSAGALFKNVTMYTKAIAQTGNSSFEMTIDQLHLQGPVQPSYTTDSTSGFVRFERVINDSTAAPIFTMLGGVNLTNTTKLYFTINSSDTNGFPPLTSGGVMEDAEVMGIGSRAFGQNFNVRIAQGSNFGAFPYQYISEIFPNGNPSNFSFEQLITPTSAVVSAGGSVPLGQHCYTMTVVFPSGNQSAVGGQQCATATTGNQTITVSWTQIPGMLYNVFRDGNSNPAQSINLSGSSFVDTFASGYSGSSPFFSGDGYPHMGTDGFLGAVHGCAETTAASGKAGWDYVYCDSTAHRLKMNNNNVGADTVVGAATTDALTNKTLNVPLTSGTGLQIFNTTTTCTTAASAGATCTTAAINLPVAEADTSYRLVCTGKGITNVPVVIATTNSSATQFTITIAALTAAAATFSSYDCLAGHN